MNYGSHSNPVSVRMSSRAPFDDNKKSDTWMNFKAIPKVELHCHLEACFRPETVMEVGKTLNLGVPQDLEQFRNEWLLTKPLENLEIALARFVDIQKIWCSEEVIERMAFEACEYAVEQNIRIMEFRYSPGHLSIDICYCVMTVNICLAWVQH